MKRAKSASSSLDFISEEEEDDLTSPWQSTRSSSPLMNDLTNAVSKISKQADDIERRMSSQNIPNLEVLYANNDKIQQKMNELQRKSTATEEMLQIGTRSIDFKKMNPLDIEKSKAHIGRLTVVIDKMINKSLKPDDGTPKLRLFSKTFQDNQKRIRERVNTFKVNMVSKDAKIHKLEKQLNDAVKSMEEIHKDKIEKLNAQRDELLKKIQTMELEKENEERLAEKTNFVMLKRTEQELDGLKEQIDALKNENERLNDELFVMKDNHQTLQKLQDDEYRMSRDKAEECNALKEEIENLELCHKDKINSFTAILNKLSAERDGLLKRIKLMQTEIGKEFDLHELDMEEIGELSQKLRAQSAQIVENAQQMEDVCTERDELQTKVDAMQVEIRSKMDKMAILHKANVKEKENEISRLKIDNAKCDGLKKEIERKKDEILDLLQNKEDQIKEISILNEKVFCLQSNANENEMLCSSQTRIINDLKQESNENEQIIQDLRSEIVETAKITQQKMSELQKKGSEVIEYEEKFDQMEKLHKIEMSNKEEEIRYVSSKNDDLSDRIKQNIANIKEKDRIIRNKNNKILQLNRLESVNRGQIAEIDKLKKVNVSLYGKLRGQESILSVSRHQISSLTATVHKMESKDVTSERNKNMFDLLNAIEAKYYDDDNNAIDVGKLIGDCVDFEEWKKVKQTLHALTTQLNESKATETQHIREIEILQEKIKDFEEIINENKQEFETKNGRMHELSKAVHELEESCEAQRIELNEKEDMISKMKADILDKVDRIDGMKKEIENNSDKMLQFHELKRENERLNGVRDELIVCKERYGELRELQQGDLIEIGKLHKKIQQQEGVLNEQKIIINSTNFVELKQELVLKKEEIIGLREELDLKNCEIEKFNQRIVMLKETIGKVQNNFGHMKEDENVQNLRNQIQCLHHEQRELSLQRAAHIANMKNKEMKCEQMRILNQEHIAEIDALKREIRKRDVALQNMKVCLSNAVNPRSGRRRRQQEMNERSLLCFGSSFTSSMDIVQRSFSPQPNINDDNVRVPAHEVAREKKNESKDAKMAGLQQQMCGIDINVQELENETKQLLKRMRLR